MAGSEISYLASTQNHMMYCLLNHSDVDTTPPPKKKNQKKKTNQNPKYNFRESHNFLGRK